MEDSNKFNEDLIKGLALEFHKGMSYLSTEFDKKIDNLRIEVGKQIDDLKFELRFDMNQMETRLNHRIDDVSTGLGSRIDDVSTGLGGKIDRIDKELTSFRKDTTGQFHEVRATLLRLDEKSSSHEERLISLEQAVNARSA